MLFFSKSLPTGSSFQILNNDNLHLFLSARHRPFHARIVDVILDAPFSDEKIYPLKLFKEPPWMVPPINICAFDINKSTHDAASIRNLFCDHLTVHDDTEHFYTDGSKSNHGAGCVAVNRSSVYSATLSNFNSSFTAELTALLLLIKNIFFHQNKSSFTIFTDSKSSLAILKSFNPDNPIVLDIHFYLIRLLEKGKRISFCWSPAHVGIEGNEEADEAAKRAATRNIVTFKPVVYKDLKHSINTRKTMPVN